MVEIREVTSRKTLKKFVDFPNKLYKNNPYFVPALRMDELTTLDPKKNPAFEHAKARYWLAYKDGEIVGRIAGIFLERYEEKWGQKRVRFGWIDFIDDKEVAFALLDKVSEWAKELGAAAIHGPMGFTDIDREGMLVEGFDQHGMMLTIYNEPYYNEYLEAYGLTKDVDWVEYTFPLPKESPAFLQKLAKRVESQTVYRLKKFKTTKELLSWAGRILDVYNQCYEHLYGTVSLSDKQVADVINQFIKMLDPELVLAVVDDKDNVVGFGLGIINLDDAVKKCGGRLFPFGFIHLLKAMKARDTYVTMLLIGVLPEVQKSGAVALMLNQIVEVCGGKGINQMNCMPELEANQDVQKLWKYFNAEIVRRRRVVIKYLQDDVRLDYDYKAEQKKIREQV